MIFRRAKGIKSEVTIWANGEGVRKRFALCFQIRVVATSDEREGLVIMTIMVQVSSQKFAAGVGGNNSPFAPPPQGKRPNLKVHIIGLVSRNYWERLPNKIDFSGVLKKVLKILDNDTNKCDTVLFSSWSIIRPLSVKKILSAIEPTNIKAVLYEEFALGLPKPRKFPAKSGASRFVVCYRKNGAWHEYKFNQLFGSLNPREKDRKEAKDAGWKVDDWMEAKARCLINRLPERVLGNCCVILCGESNIVRRRGTGKDVEVHDESHFKKAMPKNVRIVLNPGHDRMGPRMNTKRKFLSKAPSRWVLCVWNKGRKDKQGEQKFDGQGPAWMVFRDGKRLDPLPTKLQGFENAVEWGVVTCR